METTKKLFSDKYIAEFANAKGVDLNNLPSKEEIDYMTGQKAKKVMQDKKARVYEQLSVWSGGVPIDFSFSDWKVDMQKNTEATKLLGNKAYGLAKSMVNEPKSILLSGIRGTGKTSLALSIMAYLKDKNSSTMFVSTDELAETIGRQYEMPDIKAKLVMIERAMTEVDVLLLDDFGTEGGMKSDIKPVRQDMQKLMYRIANARIDFKTNKPRKSTIVTTNNTIPELSKMYNEKLISRLVAKKEENQLLFVELDDVRGMGQ